MKIEAIRSTSQNEAFSMSTMTELQTIRTFASIFWIWFFFTFVQMTNRLIENVLNRDANSAELENGADEQPPTPVQKKATKKTTDRWTHDFFDASEQAPKSRAELVNSYGYDIRNEDGPPKTRRNRRYK